MVKHPSGASLYKENNMAGIIDTLKTTGAGISGWWLSISGWLPEVVSLGVVIATLTYLIIKIYKEIK